MVELYRLKIHAFESYGHHGYSDHITKDVQASCPSEAFRIASDRIRTQYTTNITLLSCRILTEFDIFEPHPIVLED